MRIENLPNPENRFTIIEEAAVGVCSKVFKAKDKEANGRVVAIKVQNYEADLKDNIEEEYRVLRDFSNHSNLPELIGVYKKPKNDKTDEVWFVIEVKRCFLILQFYDSLLSKHNFVVLRRWICSGSCECSPSKNASHDGVTHRLHITRNS